MTFVLFFSIKVTSSTDTGLLEGSLRGNVGLFPASCVQEIRMKCYEKQNHAGHRTPGKKDPKDVVKHISKIKKMYETT